MAVMTCEQCREQIELSFGSSDFPADVLKHLQACPACRAYADELAGLVETCGQGGDPAFSSAEIEAAVSEVENRLDTVLPPAITSINWVRRLAGVAAVLVVTGALLGGYLIGKHRTVDLSANVASPGESALVATTDGTDEFNEMDDELVSVLIEDFSDGRFFGADEALLDDLSDEEMKYLEDNLTVGDML